MATVWVYPAEILPLRVRAKGAALAAAADFLGNFLVVEVTPVGLANIGCAFYFIWAALNLMNAGIVWVFYPETANLPLESIDLLFTEGTTDTASDQPFYRKLQWSVVGRAASEVKRTRKQHVSSNSGSDEALANVDKKDEAAEHLEDM